MKIKLIKEAGGYDLYRIDEDGKRVTFASTQDYKQKLSLKNCQAIERGYDLDELAEKYIGYSKDNFDLMDDKEFNSFKEGFQKCLELMGDKKFSEEDMIKFSEYCLNNNDCFSDLNDNLSKFQSLQQTEWDVKIVEFKADDLKSINNEWHMLGEPKLDADGCLILKTFKSE